MSASALVVDKPSPLTSAVARVLVVVPAHNEQESLGDTLDRIRSEMPETDMVVVNDYSTDRTSEVARAHGAVVVELPWNLGYGGAVQTGFKYAVAHGYDAVVQMDADGQHDPASARAVLAPVLAGEADVVIGSRFLGRADYAIPAPRRLGMMLFGRIATAVTHQRFSDPTSGFQALHRCAVEFFARDNYPSDFPDADTLIWLSLAGFRVREVPVVMRARTAGTSMHSNLRAVYYVAKMLLSILMVLLRHSRVPRRVAGGAFTGDADADARRTRPTRRTQS
jgi:glycosyltransferase involved in cell wall biosynthesis